MPELDHVFVCCAVGAPEAAALARVGLLEGSSNTHPGQGTANRRFFFRNAYLELVWVSDPEEAQSETSRGTRLWERWSLRHATACPFGLAFRPGPDPGDRGAPFPTWSYHPQYLPPDLGIEIGDGTPLAEPALFYLGFARRPDEVGREPSEHAIPIREITGVEIGMPASGPPSSALQAAAATGLVALSVADRHLMSLAFDGETRGASLDLRPDLPLLLRW